MVQKVVQNLAKIISDSVALATETLEKMKINFPRWLPSLIVLTLVSGLVLTGCGLPQANSSATQTTTTVNSSKQMSNLPKLEGKATVVMEVNGSSITIEVDGDNAPITAGNFIDLVERGVYDGLVFHRVVTEPQPFVAQGGDPQGKDPNFPVSRLGTGSFIDPDTNQARYIPLEIKKKGDEEPTYSQTFRGVPELQHTRGAVAMARSQMPDSASAQFYFALADLDFLDGSYAVFGYVTEGMDVVDGIKQGDRIESAKIVAKDG